MVCCLFRTPAKIIAGHVIYFAPPVKKLAGDVILVTPPAR